MLRDNEFGQFPLEFYLHRRPKTFEWEPFEPTQIVVHPIEEPSTVTIIEKSPLLEEGHLLLRDAEFHSHTLDHHIERRPIYFYYDILHHHHHPHRYFLNLQGVLKSITNFSYIRTFFM